MMRRIATTIAVATVVVATGAMAGGVPALAASHGAKATTASSFYLSLGDSLAQGVQPNLTTIMDTLTSASGSGHPPMIGMAYYDPQLAFWLRGTAADKTLAKDSV